MKVRHLIFLSLLSLFVFTHQKVNAQIRSMQQRSSDGEETTEPQSGDTPKDESALSPDTARILYFLPNINASYELLNSPALLHNFQRYNKALSDENVVSTLGNTGSASIRLNYSPVSRKNFSFLSSGFDIYKYTLDDIRIYQPEKPYSEINYMMGREKEQQLLFTHSQQVLKGLTLGLHVRVASTPGLYQRQRTNYTTGYFTASYTTPQKRYGVIAAFLTDRYRNYENGGIAYDTVFTDNTEDNRKTIAINLTNAINRDKSSGLLLQHYFNLQRPFSFRDTINGAKKKRFQAGRVSHTLKYYRVTSGFEDRSSYYNSLHGYYPATYGDSTTTLDSTFHVHFENSFVYSNIEPDTSKRDFPFQYSFGISHCIDQFGFGFVQDPVNNVLVPFQFSKTQHYRLQGERYSYTQWIPFGTLKGVIAGKTYFIANARLSLGGFNAGDHELSGKFYQYFGAKKAARLFLTVSQVYQHPDYMYYHFMSNHFRWNNAIKTQDFISGSAGIEVLGYKLSLAQTIITNYCWLDENIQPRQSDKALSVTRADFSKIFLPGRWIIDGKLTFQQISDSSVLQLPQFIASGSLGYRMILFKKVLQAEAGIHFTYFSKYYADAYMPELRSFYSQRSVMTGNYPYLDAYINMRVKRARIFFMYEHFNAKLTGFEYFLAPHYPAADASFKAGVSWVFYD